MPQITTTRVCSSMMDLDREWAIVAECPGGVEAHTVSGWMWHLPVEQIGPFLVARDDAGTITTTQRRVRDFEYVLYAKLSRNGGGRTK